MLLFLPPSGTWRTFGTQGEGLFPVFYFLFVISAFYCSNWTDGVSVWPLGGAGTGLQRREGINRPEGGQGRPWSSWTSCEFIHVAIFSQLCVYHFLCFCVWFNTVVQINPIDLYWWIKVTTWKTHSSEFFQPVHFVFCRMICFFS